MTSLRAVCCLPLLHTALPTFPQPLCLTRRSLQLLHLAPTAVTSCSSDLPSSSGHRVSTWAFRLVTNALACLQEERGAEGR